VAKTLRHYELWVIEELAELFDLLDSRSPPKCTVLFWSLNWTLIGYKLREVETAVIRYREVLKQIKNHVTNLAYLSEIITEYEQEIVLLYSKLTITANFVEFLSSQESRKKKKLFSINRLLCD
jgi:hypothetical protein